MPEGMAPPPAPSDLASPCPADPSDSTPPAQGSTWSALTRDRMRVFWGDETNVRCVGVPGQLSVQGSRFQIGLARTFGKKPSQ